MTHFNRKLSKESGNIFFALFGAVALVGVVTAATSNLIAGPMTTSVKMNRNTAADANIATSAHLILAASAKAVGGDCDADGLTEPVAPVACATAPAGAGCIPGSTGSSKTDPWNTPFAYCAYDHGARDAGVCPGRLAGENPTGPVLIALISAGPDKVFQTTCADAPAYITRAQGSDDIIKTFSPALAMQVGGGDGVWTLDPSDQTTASTAKDLSINTEMTFASAAGASFSQDSRLDLGAGGLFFLPDQNSLVDGQCNAINKGSVRRKTSPTTEALEICSGSAWVPVGVSDFLALTDTPDSYAGKQGSFVRVDGAGLQFSSAAFLDLSDTPNAYAAARSVAMVNGSTTGLTFGNLGFPDLIGFPGYVGNAGRVLRVNGAENALIASPFAFLSLNDVTATTYTGHNGSFVRVNNGSLDFSSAGFLDLRDTPNSFAGQAGKVAKVNSTANAIEFGNLNFTDLNDTPNAYSGSLPGWVVTVNATGNGLAFTSAQGVVSGGGGALDFLDLADTPNAYTGQAGMVAVVNPGETGLQFTSAAGLVNTDKAFTALTDTPNNYMGQGGKLVVVNSGGTGLEFAKLSVGGNSACAGPSVWTNAGSHGHAVGANVASLASGNGIFMSISRAGEVRVSTNGGTSWTSRTSMPADGQNYYSLAFNGSTFAALSRANSTAQLSADGVAWTTGGVVGGGAGLVMAGGGGYFYSVNATTGAVSRSLDGVSWVAATALAPASNWNHAAYSNGRLVAINEVSGITAVSSNNGTSWTYGPTVGTPAAVTAMDGQFVAVLSNGAVLLSSDGLTWTSGTTGPTGVARQGIAYAAGRFVATTSTDALVSGCAVENSVDVLAEFTDLTDTPNSYAGQAGKAVVVNAAGTGLEFSSASGGGSAGPAGINGVDGSRWHSGLGIPAAGVGLNGDYYLNLTSGDVYLKASGSWAVQGNIKGSTGATGGTGATGLPGVNGVDGSRWYSGLVAPGAGTGVTGDYYLNTTTGDVYAKAAGAWSLTGNIKGADGLTGPAGSTSFIGLTDTPASFASHAGKVVAVNAAANALEFVTPSSGGGDSGMVQSTSFLEPLAKTPFATTCSTGGTITETAEQSTLELKSSATLASGCMLSTNRTTAIQIGQQEIMHVRVSELPFALMTEGNEVFIGWSGASMTQDIKTASGSIGIYADSTKPNWQILYRNGEISTAWTDTGVPYVASGVLNVRMTVTDSNLKVEIKSNSAATVTLNRSIAIGLDGYKPRRVFGRIKRNSGSGGGNSLIVDAASIAVKVATP